jgi:hypothetical protein
MPDTSIQVNTAAVLAAATAAAERATLKVAQAVQQAAGQREGNERWRLAGPLVQGLRISVTLSEDRAGETSPGPQSNPRPGRPATLPQVPAPLSATGGRLAQQALNRARVVPRSRRLQRAALRSSALQPLPATGLRTDSTSRGFTPTGSQGAGGSLPPQQSLLEAAVTRNAPRLPAEFAAAFQQQLSETLPKADTHG